MKNLKLTLGFLAVAILTACTKEISDTSSKNQDQLISAARTNADSPSEKHAPDEVLIKFKAGTSAPGKANVLAKLEGKIKEHVLTRSMKDDGDDEGFYVIHTPAGILKAITHAKAFTEVEFAEPNYIYQHSATSNDPYILNSSLWGMMTGYGSQATTAWSKDRTGAKSVVIGVIDQGIQVAHPELTPNMWVNPKDPANGVDDDRNGYIDDVNGWDFYYKDNTVYDAGEDAHGTHVAGTIGAKGGNGTGVAGVNWNVTMISAKFLGPNGGYVSDAVKAVDYFTNLRKSGTNVVALNNSWGGGGFSQALYDAIERANNAGILFIASAGNNGSNNDNTKYYPASYTNSNVITVAAIDNKGALASFSNYGLKSVHLGAPGVAIWSTTPGGFSMFNGTSMAAPHVTGAAALYAAHNTIAGTTPRDKAARLKKVILDAAKATSTSSLNRKTVTGGRLNVSTF